VPYTDSLIQSELYSIEEYFTVP